MHNEALVIALLFLGVPFLVWGIRKLRGGGQARSKPASA